MNFSDAMTQVSRFTSLENAQTYASREMNRWIVLGDNDQFWVTTWRAAMALQRVGYTLLSV